MSAGEYCNREVVVAEPGTPVLEAAKLMRQHHVGTLVIVDSPANGAKPVGIITDRDIVIEVVAAEAEAGSLTASDIMSREIKTVQEETKLMDAIATMRAKGVRRLPVTDAKGRLVGILSVDDVLELVAEQLEDLVKLISREQRREQKLHD
jgi:CBS domain-containing protein